VAILARLGRLFDEAAYLDVRDPDSFRDLAL
jgi:hypothetical protein